MDDSEMTGHFRFDEFLTVLGRHPRFATWGVSVDEVAAVAGKPSTTLPAAVRALYAAYAMQRGKDRYGDKTPGYALQVGRIANLLPEAVFVHMVRDGRDVALSLLEAPFGPTTVAGAATFWKQRVDAAVAAGGDLGSTRYVQIRYEDLVQQPEKEVRAVCRLACIDFEPMMLDHRRRAGAIGSSTLDPSIHTLLTAPLHLARDWRREMPRDFVDRFEAVAGDSLVALGYALASP
jgi:hypothetical protein